MLIKSFIIIFLKQVSSIPSAMWAVVFYRKNTLTCNSLLELLDCF